jgi:hypothetical protein
LQRLLTLVNFAGNENTRIALGLPKKSLQISKLEKIPAINSAFFSDIPDDIRAVFLDRPVKIIVLNDKSDLQVRFDLFERLNTGGIELSHQEVRECVFRGPFMDFIAGLASIPSFKSFVHLPDSRWIDGTPEEYVLRFFAFLERYTDFNHSVKDFLNKFAQHASENPETFERSKVFLKTFEFLNHAFPNGLKTRKGMTPVNLFEGITVGAALALQAEPDLVYRDSTDWVFSAALRTLTTGATNSRPRVRGRIEFCRDQFLAIRH